MTNDHVDVTPPAFLNELVQPVRLRDGDLLLVEIPAEWEGRFAEAERWADQLIAEVRDRHGWTVTAVVLPPGAHIGQYRPVRGDQDG